MSLHTLTVAATHAVEIKHSRFIAHAAQAATPQAALQWLAQVATADATHNCWAWRIGGDYRSSDDGEPAGTAGRPILAAIDGQHLDRVMVVVTRWFGGIKLGAGGLMRAYGGAAAECLRRAQRTRLLQLGELAIHVPFANLGSAHALFALCAAEKIAESFDAHGARLVLRLPADAIDTLKTRLRDATRNRVRIDDHG